MTWTKGEFKLRGRYPGGYLFKLRGRYPGGYLPVYGWTRGSWGIALRAVGDAGINPWRTLTHLPTGLSIGEPSPWHTQTRHLKSYAAALDRLAPAIGQAQTETELYQACNANLDAIKQAGEEVCQ